MPSVSNRPANSIFILWFSMNAYYTEVKTKEPQIALQTIYICGFCLVFCWSNAVNYVLFVRNEVFPTLVFLIMIFTVNLTIMLL